MRVVELADELGLTTSEAIDACLWAGVPADSSDAVLTPEDAVRVREIIAGWLDEGFVPWQSTGEHASVEAHAESGAADVKPEDPVEARRQMRSLLRTEPDAPDSGNGAQGTRPLKTQSTALQAAVAKAGAPKVDWHRPEPEPAPKPYISAPSLPGPTIRMGGPTGWMPGGPDAHARTATLAVIALALAIASIAVPFVSAVLAIVLASVAKDKISRSRGWLKGEGLATAAQVVAGVGTGLWLVLVVGQLIVLSNNSTDLETEDVQMDLRAIRYEDVQVGMCIRLPASGAIKEWKTVACDQLHSAQVVASLTIDNAIGTPYPADGPIREKALVDCEQRLAVALADPVEQEALDLGVAYPSGASWKNENDRTVWCVAYRKDGTLLGQPLKLLTTSTTSTTTPAAPSTTAEPVPAAG